MFFLEQYKHKTLLSSYFSTDKVHHNYSTLHYALHMTIENLIFFRISSPLDVFLEDWPLAPMGFQWLILLSMVFDGYGALVKPCNGFNGSFISRGGGHMVYEVIYLERCAKINISGGYLSPPVNLSISVRSSGRQASRHGYNL